MVLLAYELSDSMAEMTTSFGIKPEYANVQAVRCVAHHFLEAFMISWLKEQRLFEKSLTRFHLFDPLA
jgi:hypothetical protein